MTTASLPAPRAVSAVRAATASLVTLVLGLVFTILGAAALELADGGAPADALLNGAPRLVVSTLGLMLPLWAAMTLVTGIRSRHLPARRRFGISFAVTVGCALLTTLAWFGVALVQGGWALLLVAISLITASIFTVGATVAAALTHLWWFRT